MSLLADQADYGSPGVPGVLYSDGYHEYSFFQTRINDLTGRFAPNNQTLLIAGCGMGYLVSLAVTAGYNAFGVDGSSWIIGQGQAALPAIASRLAVADITNATQMDAAAKTFGLHGGTPKYALLLTEDVLPCLSDAEITTALSVLRARCSSNLLHLVTPGNPATDVLDPRLNWKTIDQWRAVLCPPDVVGDCDTNLFWNATGQV